MNQNFDSPTLISYAIKFLTVLLMISPAFLLAFYLEHWITNMIVIYEVICVIGCMVFIVILKKTKNGTFAYFTLIFVPIIVFELFLWGLNSKAYAFIIYMILYSNLKGINFFVEISKKTEANHLCNYYYLPTHTNYCSLCK